MPTIDWSRDVPFADVENMSFDALVEETSKAGDHISARSAVSLVRRYIELAFHDETLSEQQRESALELASAVTAEVEKVLAGDKEALRSFQDAYATQVENGRRTGVGSLFHKISMLDGDQAVAELVKLENAPLLANFPREMIENLRPQLIQKLIRSRRPAEPTADTDMDEWTFESVKHVNAVIASGWLLLIRDPTAMWLFTGDERDKIVRYLDAYEAARDALIEANVIERTSPLPFPPPPQPIDLFQFLLLACADGNSEDVSILRGDEREKLLMLDRAAREEFFGIIMSLRFFLWKKIVGSIYGQVYLDEMISESSNDLKDEGLLALNDACLQLESIYSVAVDLTQEFPFDISIIARLMQDTFDRTLPQSESEKILQACVDALRNQLFYFPPYVRYLVRYAVNGEENGADAIFEDALA